MQAPRHIQQEAASYRAQNYMLSQVSTFAVEQQSAETVTTALKFEPELGVPRYSLTLTYAPRSRQLIDAAVRLRSARLRLADRCSSYRP